MLAVNLSVDSEAVPGTGVRLLTVAEVQDKLRYRDDHKVYKLIADGHLKAVRIGRKWLIHERSLLALVGAG